jgi:hypothetical protein
MDKYEYTFKEHLNDNILRVVWLIGKVSKNNSPISNFPLVDVWLVELNKYNRPIKDKGTLIKIAASELDSVKVGTIWKGSQKQVKNFKFRNESSKSFSFSFPGLNLTDFRTIKRSEKINVDGVESNINQGEFNLWEHLPQRQEQRASVTSYSQLTILKSSCGVDVFIPSLELFTGTYTPKHKQIRNDLLNYSLVDVINKYVKRKALVGDNKDIFYLEPKESTVEPNLLFLAHAALNLETKKRLSHVFSAVQSGGNLFIYPYHEKNMEIKSQGIWLDNNKTKFLVLRINAYSLPTEFEIQCPEFSYHNIEATTGAQQPAISFKNKKNSSPPITTEREPNKRLKPSYHDSNVDIIGSKPTVTYIKKIVENDNGTDIPSHILNEEIYSSSPGEGNYSKGNNGVSQLRNDAEEESDEVLKILPSDFLSNINTVITEGTSNRAKPFSEILYYDQRGNASNTLKYGKIEDHIFLLIKVSQVYRTKPTVKKKTAFILEFDRINEKSGCQGLIFNTEDGEASTNTIISILSLIKKNNFRYASKNDETGKMVRLLLPVAKQSVFKHSLNFEGFEDKYLAHLLSKLKYQWYMRK